MSTRAAVLSTLREAAALGLGVRRSGLREVLPAATTSWNAIRIAISRLRAEGYDITTHYARSPDPEYRLTLHGRPNNAQHS